MKGPTEKAVNEVANPRNAGPVSIHEIELIARKEADRGRNQAFAVFAFLALVISLIGLFSLNVIVGNALQDDTIEELRADAETKVLEIENYANAAQAELDSFYEEGGYESLSESISGFEAAISTTGESCRPVNSRDSSTPPQNGGNSCNNRSNWHGHAQCGEREYLRAVRVSADRTDGSWRCYFEVECCLLPTISSTD